MSWPVSMGPRIETYGRTPARFRRRLPWNISPSFLSSYMCEGAAIRLYSGDHAHGPGHIAALTVLCTGECLTMRSHMEQSPHCSPVPEYLDSHHCNELRSNCAKQRSKEVNSPR